MTPLVSVVTPTYNRAHCLGRAIDSVLAQTHSRVEVILLDDGSTDGTRALVKARYGDDRRVRYFHQPNAGVTAARNAALKHVTGDFVAFIDSDDAWWPWKLELQLACMAAHPEVGMTWTDMQARRPSGELIHDYLKIGYEAYRWWTPGIDRLFHRSQPLAEVAPGLASVVGARRFYHGDIFSPMVMGSLVHTSTVVLRRERLQRVGGFREDLRVSGEDYEFHLRTCREGDVGLLDLETIEYAIGAEDALTHPRHQVHLARNFLKTLEATLARDRARIDLPPRMIAEVVAEAHAWVGECELELGQTGKGQRHLVRSLLTKPRQPRLAGMLALSLLPAGTRERLRAAYRGLRGRA
jgi:GT2 family glycosyltransferase